jgi:hypothetical protein
MGLLEASAAAARGLRHSTHFEPSLLSLSPQLLIALTVLLTQPHDLKLLLSEPTRARIGAPGPGCRPPRRSKIRRVDHSIKERESTIVVKERLIKAYAHMLMSLYKWHVT